MRGDREMRFLRAPCQGAQEAVNYGLHPWGDIFVAGPAIRQKSVVSPGGIDPD
jgi:hypothetical protein